MFKAWEVGVKLSLINGVSTGLFAMARNFQSLNKDIGGTSQRLREVEQRMGRLRTMGMIGAGFAAVGTAGLAAFKGPIDAVKQYENAYNRFKAFNFGAVINQQANEFARSTKVIGASSTELMETLSATAPLFNDWAMTKSLAPKIAALNKANTILFSGKVDSIDEGAVRNISKFVDRRGGTASAADYLRGINIAEKLVAGSGGAVTFRDLASWSQYGGTAFQGLSDEGTLMMAGILQETGGHRAGTAMMSMYQNLVSGRTPVKTMAEIAGLGLGTMGQVTSGAMGGKQITSTVLSSIKDSELLQSNPIMWIIKDMIPAMEKAGYSGDQQLREVNMLLSNRRGSALAAYVTKNAFQVMRDFDVTKNAMGIDEIIKLALESPLGKDADLTAKWNTALVQLGEVALPTVIKLTEGFTTWLTKIIDFSTEHPSAFKALTGIFAATMALSAVGGSIMMASAALRSLGTMLTFASVGGAGGIAASATALGLLGTALGAFLAIAIGITAGAIIGSTIYDKLPDLEKQNLGRALAMIMAFFGNEDAKGALRTNLGVAPLDKQSPFIKPNGGPPLILKGSVSLDGRIVGDIVGDYLGTTMLKPTGPTRFDPVFSVRPQGMNK